MHGEQLTLRNQLRSSGRLSCTEANEGRGSQTYCSKRRDSQSSLNGTMCTFHLRSDEYNYIHVSLH